MDGGKVGTEDLFHSFNSDFANNKDGLLLGISSDGKHFTGVWNLIKYIAQSIIYSRASMIDGGKNFFTNVTVEEFYNLMAWVHWSRDVLYVKNGKAAAEGGVMMAKILQALSSRSSSNHEEEYDVAFIIGHDGNLNAVATALGMTWTLPPPYHPGYLPTPPGSALHFAYDGNEVELSFMAPVLFADHTMTLNTSGTLIEVPVKFDSYDTEYRGGSVTIVPSLYALKEQTRNSLSEYNGAMECFIAAEKIYSSMARLGSSRIFVVRWRFARVCSINYSIAAILLST